MLSAARSHFSLPRPPKNRAVRQAGKGGPILAPFFYLYILSIVFLVDTTGAHERTQMYPSRSYHGCLRRGHPWCP